MIDYFVELCDYYIENNDLTEKEKEKMREVLRGEKKRRRRRRRFSKGVIKIIRMDRREYRNKRVKVERRVKKKN